MRISRRVAVVRRLVFYGSLPVFFLCGGGEVINLCFVFCFWEGLLFRFFFCLMILFMKVNDIYVWKRDCIFYRPVLRPVRSMLSNACNSNHTSPCPPLPQPLTTLPHPPLTYHQPPPTTFNPPQSTLNRYPTYPQPTPTHPQSTKPIPQPTPRLLRDSYHSVFLFVFFLFIYFCLLIFFVILFVCFN